jgi:hypothetical protein
MIQIQYDTIVLTMSLKFGRTLKDQIRVARGLIELATRVDVRANPDFNNSPWKSLEP